MTYAIGSQAIAAAAMLIPLVTCGLLWASILLRRDYYRRRYQGLRLAWEMWISTGLLTLALVGAFYWYLFWRPYYSVQVPAGEPWALGYSAPARSTSLRPEEIVGLEVADERLPIIRLRVPRRLLVIRTADGRSYYSAPAGAEEVERLERELSAALAGATAQSRATSP